MRPVKSRRLIIWDLDDSLFDTTGQLNGSYEKLGSITLFEGVRKALALPNINVLVTTGDEAIQNRKIDILGIRGCFADIFICASGEDKYRVFITLGKKYQGKVDEIVVFGNRIDCEIRYGNQCGFRTIHLGHGKYRSLIPTSPLDIPLHRVATCMDLIGLIL